MKIDVKKIATLSNLPLKDEEIPKFEKQLGDILTYIDKLNELDTKNTPSTAQVTGLSNVLRNDEETHSSFTQEEAVAEAREKHDGMFIVPQLLEEK